MLLHLSCSQVLLDADVIITYATCLKDKNIMTFPCFFLRMAPRLKVKVKPNRRVPGCSECGTHLITSILSVLLLSKKTNNKQTKTIKSMSLLIV